MSARRHPPTAESVSRMFSDLLGRSVDVTSRASSTKIPKAPCVVVSYADNEEQLRGLCVYDFAVAASLGAALSLLPVGRAETSVQDKSLDDTVLENFQEVCNVLARLFNTPSTPGAKLSTLRFRDVKLEPSPPADVLAFVAAARTRVHLDVSVQGYKSGTLSLLV